MNEDEQIYYEDGHYYRAYVGEISYRIVEGKWVAFEFTESGEWVEA